MSFDLLLKGGEVVDPGAGYSGKKDVAIKRDRIAAVDANIPAESAHRVIDVTGQFVTPALIDMHAHVYEHATYWGVNADAIGSHCGVTTWADPGTAGAVNLYGFRKHIIEQSKTRIFVYLNIAYTGMVGQDYELRVPEYLDLELLERAVNENRDIVVGIKVRTGRSGGALDLLPLQKARQGADKLGIPIMVHLSTQPPTLEEVLAYLKPGDIITHCYTGQNMRLVDDNGKIKDAAKKAWESGVIMDLGHGAGSLSFKTAEALISQGYWPDTLSTDLHWMSIFGAKMVDPLKGSAFGTTEEQRSIVAKFHGDGAQDFNITTVMDKFLMLGMPFADVIKHTTQRPAEVLGVQGELGTLRPGTVADIATFVIDQGDWELRDIQGDVRHGKEKVRNVNTILRGQIFKPLPMPEPPMWVDILHD